MIPVTKTVAAAFAATSSTALSKLCQANLGILTQKLGLLEALTNKHGKDKAKELFQTTCPLVQASVGQHFRHSLDHMEIAASIAEKPMGPMPELHYDLRSRGGASESDMDAATERIFQIIHKLEVVSLLDQSAENNTATTIIPKQEIPAQAYFMLSGDSDTEYALTTSIGRELGFAAHHAIHHMALVKLIATQTLGLDAVEDLPQGFGRAPSTINFDSTQPGN
jgi:hypothetical protein